MLWLKRGICTHIYHYPHSTKNEDNPILHIVTLLNFLPVIVEFWFSATSNLFLISISYHILN